MDILSKIRALFSRERHHFGFVHNEAHESDPRNLRYEEISPLGGSMLPTFGDVERNPWTLNQLYTTSCTCHSSVNAFHNHKDETQIFFSPRYAFKKIKTDPKYNSHFIPWGAYMRDSLILKINEGVCEYALCPNENVESDQAYLNFSITPAMEENAKRFKGGAYIYVTDASKPQEDRFDDIVRYMAEQGEGVKVGIDWRTSFNDARTTGIVPAVAPSGDMEGHDMFAVAWKSIGGVPYLGFRNSFGKDWGDHGRIWLPRGLFKIQSAIAYLDPEKPLADEIRSFLDMPAERDFYLEQSNAALLRKMLLTDFPLDVNVGSQEANMVARSLAGKFWLALPPAVTYGGWTITDVKNWLYARSRNKNATTAYTLDFTRRKPA